MTETAHPEVPPPPSDTRRRWRNRVPLLIVLALTLIGVGTAVYDAFAPTTEEPLDAHSHAAVVQSCDTAYRTLKALPPLTHRTTRTELRARIVQEDAIFDAMVARFDRVRPTNQDGRTALRDWTADWRSVLARRAQYAQQLTTTTKHIDFVVPISPAGAPVTDRMNQYSRTHGLAQCFTENLQAETLDTIRQYPRTETANNS